MVSAVILSYNRREEVLCTLNLLQGVAAALPFRLEIIVVDNGSVDGTSPAISEHYPEILLVSKPANNGIAGWNEGFKVATQPYFLVLDDDSCMLSGMPEAVQYMEENAGLGILALNIVDASLNGDPDLDPEDSWKDQADVVGFIGCGALIRKEVYDKIGGYADWIFLYTHEFDYSIRCLQAGFKVRFFKQGTVVHRISSINRSSKSLLLYSTRNELAIVYKHFSTDRFKYLCRTLFNNLKIIKRRGPLSAWYVTLGFIKFLQFRRQLGRSPVATQVQDFYVRNFWSTKPVIGRLNKK